MKRFANKRAEGYIDVAVTIMIFAFALIFIVNVVSLVALNQNMKTAADQIAEYASMSSVRKSGCNLLAHSMGVRALMEAEECSWGIKSDAH